ncbi:uncharacterized protein DUF3509 [Pseudomonas duriflava]|uniref:Uncharacterized protein DUF3509 n=1 Tax=Pseudomonas duriflava TaxID=459528 RepID=A0A562QR69_9PSED|nr:DUF3509 domain-containing protein [Pseudomonas duriflava]TWI58576.1 uncharacterized protein DUF3509 [Pseudomonas duriflava]
MSSSPLQSIAQAFEAEFSINFLIESLDGNVVLVLTDQAGTKIRRLITAEQLADPLKVKRIINAIRFGLAIDAGHGLSVMKALSEPANEKMLVTPSSDAVAEGTDTVRR